MKELLVGTLTYFLMFAFSGAVIASFDDAETRAFFAVVGQPVDSFWMRFWSYIPEGLGESGEVGALISPFYFFLSWFFRTPAGLSMPRFPVACGLAGVISSIIIISYLIAIGRAIWPHPWYQSPWIASLPSALVFIFLVTLCCACAALRTGRR